MITKARLILAIVALAGSVSSAVPVVGGNTAAFWRDRAVIFATVAEVADDPAGQRQIIKLRIDRVCATDVPVDILFELHNPVEGGPYFAQVQVGKQYLFCPIRVGDEWVIECKHYRFLDGTCIVETSVLSDDAKSKLEKRVLAVRNEALARDRAE